MPRFSSFNMDRAASTVYDVLIPKIRVKIEDYRLKSKGSESIVLYAIYVLINGKKY